MSNENKRITPYPLRLEPSLRSKLEKTAKTHGRSLNTEIAMRLKASLLTPNEQFLDNIDLEQPESMKRLEEIVEKIMNKKKV